MAKRLASQGFRVSGWTRSGIAAEKAASLGIAAADDLAGLASASDIIIFALFDEVAALGFAEADLGMVVRLALQ